MRKQLWCDFETRSKAEAKPKLDDAKIGLKTSKASSNKPSFARLFGRKQIYA